MFSGLTFDAFYLLLVMRVLVAGRGGGETLMLSNTDGKVSQALVRMVSPA